jgi:hypothetical protein
MDVLVKVYDKLERYPEDAGEKAFRQAIRRLRDTCGISFELAESIVRVFTKEMADALVQNKILEVPHMGTFYFYNKTKTKQSLSFRMSAEFKATRNKGGTDENNFIRTVEKSPIRRTKRNGGSIYDGE